jgi:WD40 repeat protein
MKAFATAMAALSAIAAAFAQQPQPAAPTPPPATDIWLARLHPASIEFPINITAHPGYDNQPSFTADGKAILFTRRDGEQTDIYAYDFTSRSSSVTRVTNTPESEYSPTIAPDGGISVIRVEGDGTQRLWEFARDGGSPRLLLTDVKPVGYHAWSDERLLALFVLGTPNTLQLADTRTGKAAVIARRIGRSMHRIPGRTTISVLHTENDGGRWIKEFDVKSRELKRLVRVETPGDGDYAWTPDGSILMVDKDRLLRWRPDVAGWQEVANLRSHELEGVTRIAVSPDGKWIAMVAPDAVTEAPSHREH